MHNDYGVGSIFDTFNELITNITLIVHCLIRFIHSYLSDIDYNTIVLDAITTYSKMKETVITTYNANIDKDSVINMSLEYSLYCIEFIKSLLFGYRIEPFNNNWISISYIDQSEYEKKILSFSFDETYDELDTIHFFKSSLTNDDNNYKNDFDQWFETAKTVLINDRKVYDCLISMRLNDKYIYKVCDTHEKSFYALPCEYSCVKFLNIEYCHHELKNPIVIHIDKNAYLIGNEILSCTFVKRSLEYSFNINNFDTDYVLKIMDNDLNIFELKSNQYIVLEKDTYKIIQKMKEDYVLLDGK